MSAGLIAFVLTAVFVASAISGLFGMAGGSLLMAALTYALPVGAALALHGAAQLVSNLSRAGMNWRHVRYRTLGWFALGAGAGLALLSVVAYQPSRAVLFIAMGLLPVLVWIPARWVPLDAARPSHAAAGGFLVCALALTAGVSGPLSELFLIRSSLTRHQVIGTKAAMQVFAHLAKLVFYGGALLSLDGGKGVQAGLLTAVAVAAVLGAFAGRRFLDALSEDRFRRWRRWIFTALGAGFLIQGLALLAGP